MGLLENSTCEMALIKSSVYKKEKVFIIILISWAHYDPLFGLLLLDFLIKILIIREIERKQFY
jgi:hypothetical protein